MFGAQATAAAERHEGSRMHSRHSEQRNLLETVAGDSRADGATRQVAIGGGRVSIRRRLQGIEMHVGVPVAAYAGVVLAMAENASGKPYQVSLAHSDPDLSVTLLQAEDDGEAMAGWQHWARLLALPALVDRGAAADPDSCVPPGAETTASFRRQSSPSTVARRPRFLVRRKPGRAELQSVVHRGEREIVCYE
jgi:hypothetical protein